MCVSECSFCVFFGVAKTKFHGIARGRLQRGLTSPQTKLNIKQSTLYCRLTRHENLHAIGWKRKKFENGNKTCLKEGPKRKAHEK